MQKVKDIDKLKEAKRQAKVDSSSVNDSAESSSSAHDADASDAASDIDDSTDASNSVFILSFSLLDLIPGHVALSSIQIIELNWLT